MGQILGILGEIYGNEDAWTSMDLVGDGIRNSAKFGAKSPIKESLQNKLILRQIFLHVPTNMLLSSCSLVSKTWNKEARKFIMDCRKCTVKNSECTSVCEFLQELDQFCQKITKDGRLVPFNSLILDFGKPCCSKVTTNGQDFYGHIQSALKLKYLAILNEWIDRPDCSSHKPLLTLLSHKANGLQSLTIDSIHPFKNAFCPRWFPQFTKLEELDIAGMGLWLQKPPESVQKLLVRWLLKEAPNLKSITAGELKNLRIVPEEILARVKLQGRLEIHLQTKQDLDLLQKVSNNKALKLQELCIHEPRPILRVDEDDDGVNLCREFDSLVHQVLQLSQQSLQTIEIVGAYRLPRSSSHISLVNVSKFIIKKPNTGAAKKLWRAIASIEFERIMPGLEEVEVTIHSERFPRAETIRNELKINCSRDSSGDMTHVSSNALKLILYLKEEEMELGPLQAIFPNVSAIHLTLFHEYSYVPKNAVDPACRPVPQIFKYWPNLVQFIFMGKRVPCDGNYDAEFCGIHKEEVEILRQMDQEYLRRVHIVPIRPCVLTMPRLNKVWIESDQYPCWYWLEDYQAFRPSSFVSRVTKMVALERIPGMDVSVVYA